MSTKMSQITRQEVLAAQRDRYAGAGKEHKTKIINELVELLATTARRPSARCNHGRSSPRPCPGATQSIRSGSIAPAAQSHLAGRTATLRGAAQGVPARLAGRLRGGSSPPERRCAPSVVGRQPRHAGPALIPARIEHRRRATTRPGTFLRHQIPIRTEWAENGRAFWRGTRWPYAGARWMTGTAGCSTPWTFTPLGMKCAPCPTAAKPRRYCRFGMSRQTCPSRCSGWTATMAASSSTIIWLNI